MDVGGGERVVELGISDNGARGRANLVSCASVAGLQTGKSVSGDW